MMPERGKEAPKGIIEEQKFNLILLQQEFLRTKTLQLKEMHEMVIFSCRQPGQRFSATFRNLLALLVTV